MLASLVALNYLRIAVIDPILKGERCNAIAPNLYGYQSLDAIASGHRMLGGGGGGSSGGSHFGDNTNDDEIYLGTPACNTYLIGFNLCCAVLLILLAISVYVLSTIYIDRVIRRSLELDKIDNHPDGIRYAYKDSLDIMVRREKMLAHAELLRKKRMKLGIMEQEFTASRPKKMDSTLNDSGKHSASNTSDQMGDKIGSFLQHGKDHDGGLSARRSMDTSPAQTPVHHKRSSMSSAFSDLWGSVQGGRRSSAMVIPNDHDNDANKGEEQKDKDEKKAEEMEVRRTAPSYRHIFNTYNHLQPYIFNIVLFTLLPYSRIHVFRLGWQPQEENTKNQKWKRIWIPSFCLVLPHCFFDRWKLCCFFNVFTSQ